MKSYSQVAKCLWTTRQTRVSYPQRVSNLTYAVRSTLAGEPLRRIARRRGLVLVAGLLLFTNSSNALAVNTAKDVNNYKLYAHIKLHNANEYQCLVLLWDKESKWNPRANNPKSTAYGIPQLLKMTERDPYKQILLGLKYIKHRHKTPCLALEHHKKGWY